MNHKLQPEHMGKVHLQVGMKVRIKQGSEYAECSGTVKTITKDLPDYYSERAFELDNNQKEIWVISDFERCENYPNLLIS